MATEDSGMATKDSSQQKVPAEPVDINEDKEKAAEEVLPFGMCRKGRHP